MALLKEKPFLAISTVVKNSFNNQMKNKKKDRPKPHILKIFYS